MFLKMSFSKHKEHNYDLEAYIIYTFTIDKTLGVSLYLSDYDMCYSFKFVMSVMLSPSQSGTLVSSHTKTTQIQTSVPTSMIYIRVKYLVCNCCKINKVWI